MNTLHNFLFNVFPYICLTVFLMGSLARFDRDQYTWRSDSSQLLRKGQLKWGSNLFHIGILFLFFGHAVGLLTPSVVYELVMTAGQKKTIAMVAGGIAGFICFIGLTLLLHRRLFDPRIRLTSRRTDLLILIVLWVQLVLGLGTLPFSMGETDGAEMQLMAAWAQSIFTFNPNASLLVGVHWVSLVHIVLGMTIFLLFPFSRLVHVWSGFGTLAYVLRPYQLVRIRKLGLNQRAPHQR